MDVNIFRYFIQCFKTSSKVFWKQNIEISNDSTLVKIRLTASTNVKRYFTNLMSNRKGLESPKLESIIYIIITVWERSNSTCWKNSLQPKFTEDRTTFCVLSFSSDKLKTDLSFTLAPTSLGPVSSLSSSKVLFPHELKITLETKKSQRFRVRSRRLLIWSKFTKKGPK